MPLVSVIVPVYKVEKYLKKCVDSILSQTLKDIEVILVDDGSPDGCPSLCEDYAKIDSRVLVIHKENGGLSSARNAGLDVATGKYIGFVDSDDYIDNQMYEKLYNKISETDADICICSHKNVVDGVESEYYLPFNQDLYTNPDTINNFIIPLIGHGDDEYPDSITGFVCRNLYKSEIFLTKRFKSERKYFAEDVVLGLELYGEVRKISVVNQPLYYYVCNSNSLTNKYRDNLWEMLCTLLDFKEVVIEKYSLQNKTKVRMNNEIIKGITVSTLNYCKKGNTLSRKQKIQRLKVISSSKYFKMINVKCFFNSKNYKGLVFFLLLRFNLYGFVVFLLGF